MECVRRCVYGSLLLALGNAPYGRLVERALVVERAPMGAMELELEVELELLAVVAISMGRGLVLRPVLSMLMEQQMLNHLNPMDYSPRPMQYQTAMN